MTALSNEEFMEYAGLSDEEKRKPVIELLMFSAEEWREGVSFRRTSVVSDQAHVIVCILSSLLQQTEERRGVPCNYTSSESQVHRRMKHLQKDKHMSMESFFGRQLSSTKELNQRRFATIVSQKTDGLQSLGLFH